MALQPAIKVEDGKVMGAFTSQAKNVSYGSGSVEDALDNMHMASNPVALPYTPPTDGIIIASIRGGSTAGQSYVVFRGTQPNIIAANITTNQFYTGSLAVKKGVPVSISESSNIYICD